MAFANASVHSALPLLTAPNLVIGKSRAGKIGALMRARICKASDQGSSSAIKALGSVTLPNALLDRLDNAIPAPPANMLLVKSRRLVILRFLCQRYFKRVINEPSQS